MLLLTSGWILVYHLIETSLMMSAKTKQVRWTEETRWVTDSTTVEKPRCSVLKQGQSPVFQSSLLGPAVATQGNHSATSLTV